MTTEPFSDRIPQLTAAKPLSMKIKIWQSKKNKQFYVSIVASNGRKVFTSEGYKRVASANKAEAMIRRWAHKEYSAPSTA